MKTFSHEESRERNEKYRTIFEYSAVSLWEEDISKLRLKLSEMKAEGINLRAHIDAHPEFIQEATHLIEVTDVNQASVLLFEADTKEHLLGPLNIVLDSVSWTALAETILAIDEEKGDIESESSAITLNGRKLFLIVRTHIPPPDAAYPSMLVSLIDITARKESEERERRSAIILESIIESSPDMIYVKDASLRMVLCNSVTTLPIGKEPKDTYGKTDVESGWSFELVKGNAEKGIIGWESNDLAALSGNTVQATEETWDFENVVRYFDTSKFPLRDKDGAIPDELAGRRQRNCGRDSRRYGGFGGLPSLGSRRCGRWGSHAKTLPHNSREIMRCPIGPVALRDLAAWPGKRRPSHAMDLGPSPICRPGSRKPCLAGLGHQWGGKP